MTAASQPQDRPVAPAVVRQAASAIVAVMRTRPVAEVPGGLRFARDWHPDRVPRAGGQRLLATVLADDQVRSWVVGHLASLPNVLPEGEAGDLASDEGPDPRRAARLLLTQPSGWEAQFQQSLPVASPASADDRQQRVLQGKVERLQQRLDRDVAAARAEGLQARTRLEAENATLRQQVELFRDSDRAAKAAQDQLTAVKQDLAAQLRLTRRLQGQLDAAQAKAAEERASDREDSRMATARVKVLLAVLQEASAGLARELNLPAGISAPADLVAGAPPSEPAIARRIESADGLLAALQLPQAHLIVDGYNVSKGLWAHAPLQQQRAKLVAALRALQARTGAEITVVFDGAAVGPVPALSGAGVRVRFSEPGQLADRVIVRLVEAEPAGRVVVVASSDAAVGAGARNLGSRTCSREVLAALLQRN